MRTSNQEHRGAGRDRCRRLVGVTLLAATGFTSALALLGSASPAAAKELPTASFTVDHTISYLGATAEPYVFTMTNTGADPIVQFNIVVASDSMLPPVGLPAPVTITGCPAPPAGWAATFTARQCRWSTTPANAVLPGESRAFTVQADVAPGSRDRVATFTASPGGPALASPAAGIDVAIHAWEITDAVMNTGAPVPVNGACPAPRRQAPSNATVGMVVCGINHMTATATPGTASLAGGLIEPPPGTWTSGPVTPSATPRVLGNWANVTLDQATGEHTVTARVQSTAAATSPPTTFEGFTTNTPPVANDDAYTMDEGSTLTVAAPGLLANDTDADGDPLEVVLWWDTLPGHGQVMASADGSFTFLAHGNYHGTVTFTYRATDGSATSDPATGTITILPVPDQPYDLTLSAQIVAENQPSGTVVGTFSTADFDLPGDSHTYSLVSGAGFAVVGSQLTTTGPLDFEAGATRSIRVRSTDSAGLSVEKDLTITLTNVNEAPTAIALAPSSVAENVLTGVTVGTLSTTDVDADDSFTYSVVGPSPFGTLGDTLRTVGVINFEEGATRTVRIRSVDAGGLAFEQDVIVTIVNVNESPRNIDLAPSTVAENQPIGTTVGTLTTEDFDLGETFTYNIIGPAPFTIAGDQLVTASSFDFEAGSTVTVTVRTADTGGLTHEEDLTVTITDVNEAPTNVTLLPSSVAENQPAGTTVGTLSTTDPDAGGTFTYAIVGAAPFTVTGDQLKTAVGFDFEALETHPVTVRTTDVGGLSFDKLVIVTVTNVNDAPIAVDGAYAVPPAGVTVAAPGVLGNDSDPDVGTTLTAVLLADAAHGTLILDADGSFTYTPDAGTTETTDSFTYRASDGTLSSNVATVTLSLNQPPVAVDDAATTTEDTFVDIDVSANDTDAEKANSALTATSIAGATNGTAVLQPGNRIVRFTPTADFNGTGSFTYRATDGTTTSTATATVTITVTPVNDAPVIADPNPGTTYTERSGSAAAVSPNAALTDVDDVNLESATLTIVSPIAGDELTFLNGNGITGNVVGNVLTLSGSSSKANYQTAIRQVRFRNPTSSTPGASRTITVKVDDGSLESNLLNRTITITQVNDRPVMTLDAGSVTYAENGAAVAISPNLTVSDADDADLTFAQVGLPFGDYDATADVLSYTGSLPPGVTFSGVNAVGTLQFVGTASVADYQALLRTVTYRHTSDDPPASRTILFRVGDGSNPSLEKSRVITITPANDFPTITGVETTPLAYTEQGVAVVVSSAITVADADSARLAFGGAVIDGGLQPGDALAFTPQSGITGTYDAASGALLLTGSATPAQYQAALRSVTFASTSDDAGPTRHVRFSVNDGALNSSEQGRTINVTAVDDPPVVTTTAGTTSANQQVTTVIDGGLTVTDPDSLIAGATVRLAVGFNAAQDVLALPGQPRAGGITATLSGDTLTLTGTTTAANYQAALRAVTYTNTSLSPTTGVRTARFRVTDATGVNSPTADKSIQPVDGPDNVAPTDGGESYMTNGNTALWVDDAPAGAPVPMRTSTVNLLDNAADDGPTASLTTVSSTGAAHGEVVLATDGSFVYTPDAGYTGPDSFTYRVSDGTSVSALSTVSITVERRVWYVDNRASAGDGRSSSPFNVLEAADVAATATNDIIFVREGTRTATGYTTDVDLLSGQALLGEGAPLYVGVDLVFDADGTDVPLIDGTVNLGSGNTVRGLKFVGSGATPAIVGGTGDNGGTLMDLQIIGEQPGIELVGTTGDWKVWDVSIDVTSSIGLAFRAENAGVLDFTANGTIALRGSGAGALRILNTVTTGTIDSVVTGEGSTTGVDIQNTGGNLTIEEVSLKTADTALRLYKADAITIGGGTVTSTGGFDGISVISSNDSSINVPSGSLTGSSIGFHVAGGTGDITYGGSIGNVANPNGGFAVEISDHESGAIRLTGRIASNGSVSVGGGESAPVEITGANNVVTATGITALSVREQLVGPGGIRFRALSAPTANYGIYLHRTTGGPVSVTGSGSAGSGGTLRTVHLEATDGSVSLDGLAVAAAGNQGIEAHNARSLTVRNSAVSGSGNGVVLTATDGQNDYVFENNSIVLSVGGSNTAFTLSNPILTAPSTRIWLLGNVVSGAQLDAVQLLARGTAEVVGQITDNMISRYCQSGLALTNMQGTAITDYTVTGNVLTDDCPDASDTVRTGFAAQSGTGTNPGTTGDDGGELCLDARGNALSNSGRGLPGDFLLQVVNEATFFIPGLGSSDPGTLFVDLNSADGPPVGSVQDTATPPGGFLDGTCGTLGVAPG